MCYFASHNLDRLLTALHCSNIVARLTSSKDKIAFNNSLETWLGGQGPQALEPGTRPKPKPAPKPKGKRGFNELEAREFEYVSIPIPV